MGNCCGHKSIRSVNIAREPESRNKEENEGEEGEKIGEGEKRGGEREERENMNEIDRYHVNDLTTQTFENLPKFTFNGLVTKAKVVDIYDGDTITIVFYYNNQPIKDSFRMLGYDSPEMKPLKSIDNRELHIEAAKCAKLHLSKLILNRLVWVCFCQEEKYGRLMGEIYLIGSDTDQQMIGNELNVNKHMIDEGYGKTYEGGHKSDYSQQDLLSIVSRGI